MDRPHPTESAPSPETSPSTTRAELGVLRAELPGDTAEPQVERLLEPWGITLLPSGVVAMERIMVNPADHVDMLQKVYNALLFYPPEYLRPFSIRIGLSSGGEYCFQADSSVNMIALGAYCKGSLTTETVHHEIMHIIDSELQSSFEEHFSVDRYHGDIAGHRRYRRNPGFADQWCMVSRKEELARLGEALWNSGMYQAFTALGDPVVTQKLRMVAQFYRSKGIRAPYINTLLGAEQQPAPYAAYRPGSKEENSSWNRPRDDGLRNASPDWDGFLGRAVFDQDWYIYVWTTKSACEKASGKPCQPQPNGNWAYYRNKAEVDRALGRRP